MVRRLGRRSYHGQPMRSRLADRAGRRRAQGSRGRPGGISAAQRTKEWGRQPARPQAYLGRAWVLGGTSAQYFGLDSRGGAIICWYILQTCALLCAGARVESCMYVCLHARVVLEGMCVRTYVLHGSLALCTEG